MRRLSVLTLFAGLFLAAAGLSSADQPNNNKKQPPPPPPPAARPAPPKVDAPRPAPQPAPRVDHPKPAPTVTAKPAPTVPAKPAPTVPATPAPVVTAPPAPPAPRGPSQVLLDRAPWFRSNGMPLPPSLEARSGILPNFTGGRAFGGLTPWNYDPYYSPYAGGFGYPSYSPFGYPTYQPLMTPVMPSLFPAYPTAAPFIGSGGAFSPTVPVGGFAGQPTFGGF